MSDEPERKCRWCERERNCCPCGICSDCHEPFWGDLKCVQTKKDQNDNVKKY